MIESEKLAKFGGTPAPSARSASQRQLDDDTFRLVADWYHFAILNLLDCEGFRWNATYVSRRLKISAAQANFAMGVLNRLGLVHVQNGKAKPTTESVLSTVGTPSAAVRAFHRQMLEKSIEALELQTLEERDISGVGFAFDPKRLPEIKKEISEFVDDLVLKYSKGKRHEVYFLETALFQISQKGAE